MNKTKAQMNWEVGKEQQENFMERLRSDGNIEQCWIDEVDDLFKQIRQNEYRRGKEDGKNEIIKLIEEAEPLDYGLIDKKDLLKEVQE
jgi:hypothetical protein